MGIYEVFSVLMIITAKMWRKLPNDSVIETQVIEDIN